jgi:heme/copper-type cytochrome/quinol oxidase subunit 3
MVRDYCCDCPTGRSETNQGGHGYSRECRERLSFQEECFVRVMKVLQVSRAIEERKSLLTARRWLQSKKGSPPLLTTIMAVWVCSHVALFGHFCRKYSPTTVRLFEGVVKMQCNQKNVGLPEKTDLALSADLVNTFTLYPSAKEEGKKPMLRNASQILSTINACGAASGIHFGRP